MNDLLLRGEEEVVNIPGADIESIKGLELPELADSEAYWLDISDIAVTLPSTTFVI